MDGWPVGDYVAPQIRLVCSGESVKGKLEINIGEQYRILRCQNMFDIDRRGISQ